MKIRMKMDVAGSFHGIDGGVRYGQVVDVQPDQEALRYIALNYAEAVGKAASKVEHATSPKAETAALTTEQAAALTETEAEVDRNVAAAKPKPSAPAKKAAPPAK